MSTEQNDFETKFTVFFLVKTSPEWLGFTFETRLNHARTQFQPLLEEFKDSVRLKWYDVEFYTALHSDIWMIEAKDHDSYQLFCEKLRETPFWDTWFFVNAILPGEQNAWAKNYQVEAMPA